MKVVSLEDNLAKPEAIKVLSSGGIIIFPTETSYGVGVDATNKNAVTKLLKYKQRPEGKAISVAVISEEMAQKYVEINESAQNLYKNFLPGPVTVISKSIKTVDERLESEGGTLGIRVPNYKFILDLIEEFGKPITSTSANASGKKTPYSIDDILEDLTESQKELIDLIIDAGTLPKNPPSTVIDTTTQELTVYRQGRIDPMQMQSVLSEVTKSVDETILFGEQFYKEFLINQNAPKVILLNGELGAGKTHLVKGIAKALGIKQIIKSPTYNYVSEYKLNEDKSSLLYHFDAWRIQSKNDLELLRFYDWFSGDNVIVIEWPTVVMNLDEDFFKNLKNYYYFDFINLSENEREIRVYKKF
jgi:L-threonylcarbamoyladenylate synthase